VLTTAVCSKQTRCAAAASLLGPKGVVAVAECVSLIAGSMSKPGHCSRECCAVSASRDHWGASALPSQYAGIA
jgi:hypothetical protein